MMHWCRVRALSVAWAAAITLGSLDACAVAGSAGIASYDVTIGVFFDAQGTVCAGTIRPDVPGTIYILAKAAPGSEIPSGAEFRFVGLPSAWTVYPVPNPQTLSIGDPFANGVNIASVGSPCSTAGTSQVLLLYTVLVLASDLQENVRFELVARNPPANPAFNCPLVTECGPFFAIRCVQSVPCFVNASAPPPCAAPTGVEVTTWTGLRALYR